MDLEEINKSMLQLLLILIMIVVMAACTLVMVKDSRHVTIDTKEDVKVDSTKIKIKL